MNLLGDREPAASQALLDGLTQAGNADLAEFVRARKEALP
ncbi:MAG: hypothetical protein BWZ02_00024 [Lentisphaerae bacterium ADurb.BinA184]|nr:MAG: hypothetical protein BWZ02_00024 [Lentisphaerae bacterium ADurb.BinA184]